MKLSELRDKATPGEWVVLDKKTSIGRCYRVGPDAIVNADHGGICAYDDRTSMNPHADGEQKSNAALIAHSVNHLAKVVAAWERLVAAKRDTPDQDDFGDYEVELEWAIEAAATVEVEEVEL